MLIWFKEIKKNRWTFFMSRSSWLSIRKVVCAKFNQKVRNTDTLNVQILFFKWETISNIAQIKYLLFSFSQFMEVHPNSTFSQLPQVAIKIKFKFQDLQKLEIPINHPVLGMQNSLKKVRVPIGQNTMLVLLQSQTSNDARKNPLDLSFHLSLYMEEIVLCLNYFLYHLEKSKEPIRRQKQHADKLLSQSPEVHQPEAQVIRDKESTYWNYKSRDT